MAAMGNVAAVGGGAVGGRRVAELEQEADAEEDECAAAGDANDGGGVERLRRRLAAEGRWRKATLEELEKDRCAAADEAELEQEADAEEDECATASDANGGDMEEGGSVERLRRRFVTEERRREVALEPGGAREGEARGGVRGRRG
uniref:Uncharacterized protein n=1 Tax=Oryza rufipogon TaxID=4529 RepID=A0A0E0NFG4_ORYRU